MKLITEEKFKELPNKGVRTTKILFKKKIKIGYDKDRETQHPIYLEAEIKEIDLSTEAVFKVDGEGNRYDLVMGNAKQTIEHKTISKYRTLSISGYSKYFTGQILDTIADLGGAKPQLKRILEIWKLWHLNDLQPNCIHQNSFDCNTDEYDELAKEQTDKCPNNYKYGSAWLIKDLPQAVADEIQELFTNYKVVVE